MVMNEIRSWLLRRLLPWGFGLIALLAVSVSVVIITRLSLIVEKTRGAGNLVQIGERSLRVPAGYGERSRPTDDLSRRSPYGLFHGVAPNFDEPDESNRAAFKVPGPGAVTMVLVTSPNNRIAEDIVENEQADYASAKRLSRVVEDDVEGWRIESPRPPDSRVVEYYAFEDGAYTSCNNIEGVIKAPACTMTLVNRGDIFEITFGKEHIGRQRSIRSAIETKFNAWDDIEPD